MGKGIEGGVKGRAWLGRWLESKLEGDCPPNDGIKDSPNVKFT